MISLDQLQLAAALGRPHARRAVRVLRRANQAMRDHAVPADGRDVAGLDPGDARAADRRGARRHRAGAAGPARAARRSSAPSSRTSTCSRARRSSARPESAIGLLCTGQIARRFGLPFRSGGGLTSSQNAGRAVRLRGADDDAADVPRRHELGHALGRLARGRPRHLLREVRHRHRDPADAAGRVHAARVRRGGARVRRAPGSRARRALPRRQHTMERFRTCFYRPLLSSSDNFDRWKKNGGKDAAARATDIYKNASRSTSSRRSTMPSARSSRSTSSAAAASWETDAPDEGAGSRSLAVDAHAPGVASGGLRRCRLLVRAARSRGARDRRSAARGRGRSRARDARVEGDGHGAHPDHGALPRAQRRADLDAAPCEARRRHLRPSLLREPARRCVRPDRARRAARRSPAASTPTASAARDATSCRSSFPRTARSRSATRSSRRARARCACGR